MEELKMAPFRCENGFVPLIRRLRDENECLREELRLARWFGRLGWYVAVIVSAGFALITL